MDFYTYIHCKPDGTPFYVGKGSGRRAYRIKGVGRNPHHANIVKKYGKDNVLVFIFLCDTEGQALVDEVQHIAQLRAEGYDLSNKSTGGENGTIGPLSGEHRLKISKAQKGRKQPPVSDATRMKMSISAKKRGAHEGMPAKVSASLTGRKKSPEHVAKVAAALKGYVHGDEMRKRLSESKTGKALSVEHRAKIGEAMLGKKRSDEFKEKMSVIAKARYARGEITTLHRAKKGDLICQPA